MDHHDCRDGSRAVTVTAKVLGREKLLRQMARLPPEIRSAVKQALAQSADEITDMMHNLVPIRPTGGALDASIRSVFGDKPSAPNSGVLSGGGSLRGDPELTVWILAGNEEAFYARWVEFGTVKMAAQPFFFPSYRANRRSVRARISRAMRLATRRSLGR
jgi:HK97 gp10 family phage protein